MIPKQHVPDLWSIDEQLGASLMAAVIEVGQTIRQALRPDGMNLISSAGAAASQTVFHLHLHLVPRWHDDPIGNIWPASEPWSEAELDDVAEQIRAVGSRRRLLLKGAHEDQDKADEGEDSIERQ